MLCPIGQSNEKPPLQALAKWREYVYINNDDCLAYFQSFDGYNLFIPIDALGSFLPDVADDDRVLEIVND